MFRWRKIKVDMGDTSKTIDQATTSGSRTDRASRTSSPPSSRRGPQGTLAQGGGKTWRSCREAHRARRSGERLRKSIKTHFLRAADRRPTF